VSFRIKSRFLCLLTIFGLSCSQPALAARIVFTGNFASDDEVVYFAFNVASPTTVTLQTSSFGDGALGFSPVLSLFGPDGSLIAVDRGGSVPYCGTRDIDRVSGFCLDAYIDTSLAGGYYTLALTQDDNTPNGDLGTGFLRQGEGDFTGAIFGVDQGSFILFDRSQREPVWDVELLGVTSGSQVPEPSVSHMAVLGLGFLLLTCRPRSGPIAYWGQGPLFAARLFCKDSLHFRR
jgi:PEP-CTERM motif